MIHFKGWSCLQGFCVDLSVGTAPEITGRRRHRTECHRYIEMQSNQMVWTIGLSVAQRNGTFMLLSILSFFKHAPQLGTCLRAVSSNTVGFTVVRKRSREDHDKAPISNYPGIELKAASIRILHLSPSSDKQRQRSCRS